MDPAPHPTGVLGFFEQVLLFDRPRLVGERLVRAGRHLSADEYQTLCGTPQFGHAAVAPHPVRPFAREECSLSSEAHRRMHATAAAKLRHTDTPEEGLAGMRARRKKLMKIAAEYAAAESIMRQSSMGTKLHLGKVFRYYAGWGRPLESVSMTRPAFLRMSGNMFLNEIVRRQDMDVCWDFCRARAKQKLATQSGGQLARFNGEGGGGSGKDDRGGGGEDGQRGKGGRRRRKRAVPGAAGCDDELWQADWFLMLIMVAQRAFPLLRAKGAFKCLFDKYIHKYAATRSMDPVYQVRQKGVCGCWRGGGASVMGR